MKDEKIGRKTSPGFADPHTPVRLGPHTPVHLGETPAQPPAVVVPVPPVAAPAPVPTHPAAPARASVHPASGRPRSPRSKPLVEVEVLRERSRVPRPEPLLGCYEIWTQNNVYVVDSRMRCLQVREVGGGEPKTEHPFVGARLVGGQAQEAAMEMSYPLPRPGAYAVFEMRKGNRRQFTRTSAVERVVLRLRIVTIADGADVPTWEDLIDDDE
jgi:hypothetical protein